MFTQFTVAARPDTAGRAFAALLFAAGTGTGFVAPAHSQPAPPEVAAPRAEAGTTGNSTATDERRFDVLEYRVLGNRSLDAPSIERAVYTHLGPDRRIADVEAARSALEQAYRVAGFGTVYVDIPEQDVEGGIVRLQVTEGVLRRVRVEGARYFSSRGIRAALPAATAGAAPSLPQLQRELSALNAQTPDRSVVPVLAAGPVSGTVDLTLKVQDELPLHGSVELNDQYTADTSRLRALVSLSYDNAFNRLDSVALQYQTAPQEPTELDVLVASYTARLGDAGRRLALFAVNSDTDVATLGGLSVLGRGRLYGARLIMPLVNDSAASHTLTIGADYKDFDEVVQLDPTQEVQTPISYANLSLSHTGVWRTTPRTWVLSTTLNVGPRRIGNQDGEFADKRFRGRPNYFFLRSEGSVTLPVFGDWTLLGRLGGQFAVEPLVSNEQFGVGGADGVRGYLESEELGDIGFKATLELRSPAWRIGSERFTLEGIGFADFARVTALSPLPDEARDADLSSVGLGFNFSAWEIVSGNLAWAYPLVPGSRTLDGESRLHFSVRSSW